MFRTVSLSIIESLALYTQQQVYVIQLYVILLASGIRMELQIHPDPASMELQFHPDPASKKSA